MSLRSLPARCKGVKDLKKCRKVLPGHHHKIKVASGSWQYYFFIAFSRTLSCVVIVVVVVVRPNEHVEQTLPKVHPSAGAAVPGGEEAAQGVRGACRQSFFVQRTKHTRKGRETSVSFLFFVKSYPLR